METQVLTRRDRDALLVPPAGTCVSIYLAVQRTGDGLLQPPIRLRNDAASIEKSLLAKGLRSTEARDFTAPLRELADDARFWQAQGPGVALFLSAQGLQGFRLRTAPKNAFWVGGRFCILPLLVPEETDESYRVLAISANEVTLYAGSHEGLERIPVEALPHGLIEALNLDQPRALIQVMTMPFGATFHGQGGTIDHRKGDLRNYFEIIDRALHPYLAESRLPLLFAGVEYLFPIYRSVNTYPHLLETRLAGNPERMGEEELHRRAEEILAAYHRQSRDADAACYEDLVGAHRTAERLSEVLVDAHAGAIETLFLSAGESQWGRFDPIAGTLDLTYADDPDACDLLDLAAYQTLTHRGRVHVVPANQVPHGGAFAAILRYAPTTAGAPASAP